MSRQSLPQVLERRGLIPQIKLADHCFAYLMEQVVPAHARLPVYPAKPAGNAADHGKVAGKVVLGMRPQHLDGYPGLLAPQMAR